MQSIKQLRKRIDVIDEALIKKLAQRKKLAIKIGKLKAAQARNILDKKRESLLFNRYEKLSAQYQLDPTLVKKLFKSIIHYSRKLQK